MLFERVPRKWGMKTSLARQRGIQYQATERDDVVAQAQPGGGDGAASGGVLVVGITKCFKILRRASRPTQALKIIHLQIK